MGDEESLGETQQEWSIGHDLAPTEGHEILLKAGIEMANSLGATYPSISPVENCAWGLKNPLLIGNCATDQGSLKIAWLAGSTSTSNWHTQPMLQQIHFLRNYVGSAGLVGAWRACVAGRDRIVTATRTGVALWRKNQTTDAYFYIGHASHIVQDSFAPGHTSRQSDNMVLKDICEYKRAVSTGPRKLVTTQFEPEPEPEFAADAPWAVGKRATDRARARAPLTSFAGLGLDWVPTCGAL